MKHLSRVPDMTDAFEEKNCSKCKFYYKNECGVYCTYPDDKCQKKTIGWKLGQIVAYIILVGLFLIVCVVMSKIGQHISDVWNSLF